jgi:hypothetical protein
MTGPDLNRRGFLQVLGGGAVAAASVPFLTSCGSSGGSAAGSKTLTVAYWSNPSVYADKLLTKVIPTFKSQNAGSLW